MQTITFTKRSVMSRLEQWRDDQNQMGRCSPSAFVIPGVTIGTWQDGPEDVLELAPAAPYVGQPATVCVGTDRHPATVIAVSRSGAKVTVRQDRAIRLDDNGMSDSQHYAFEEDPAGEVRVFHRGEHGYRARGYVLRLGARSAFHDYTV